MQVNGCIHRDLPWEGCLQSWGPIQQGAGVGGRGEALVGPLSCPLLLNLYLIQLISLTHGTGMLMVSEEIKWHFPDIAWGIFCSSCHFLLWDLLGTTHSVLFIWITDDLRNSIIYNSMSCCVLLLTYFTATAKIYQLVKNKGLFPSYDVTKLKKVILAKRIAV